MLFLDFNLARSKFFDRTSSQAFFAVRFGIGNLLLVAAALKAAAMFGESTDARATAMQIALIAGETVLGLWLVSGVKAGLAWCIALAVFAIFAGYSMLRAIQGAPSCDCFGHVRVRPWISVAIDLAATAALAWWQPAVRQYPARRGASAVAGPLVAVLTSLPVVVLVSWILVRNSNALQSDGATHVLTPQSWIGKTFPLIADIDASESLKHGRWRLILFHHDCPECIELLQRYADGNNSKWPEGAQVMLIEMPPYGEPPTFNAARFIHAKLSDRHTWFVKAPVEIDLDEAIVVDVLH